MIRLVLFDIDGTLIHTGGAGMKAFAKAFETEFGTTDGCAQLQFAGRTDMSLVWEFFRLHDIPLTPENFTRFCDRYVFWLDHLLEGSRTELCPGVGEFIAQSRTPSRPPLLGLLTGNIRLGAEIKLRHFHLWEAFETGAFGDDHEDRDQLAAIACQRASRVLGQDLAEDEVLVVGDTPSDIRCGRAIGARVLAVATGAATLKELQRHGPNWAVSDLTKVRARELLW